MLPMVLIFLLIVLVFICACGAWGDNAKEPAVAFFVLGLICVIVLGIDCRDYGKKQPYEIKSGQVCEVRALVNGIQAVVLCKGDDHFKIIHVPAGKDELPRVGDKLTLTDGGIEILK